MLETVSSPTLILQMVHNLKACDSNASFKPPSGYNRWLGMNESYIT